MNLSFIWDPRGYFFWLLIVSLACLVLERFFPWRRSQKVLRRGFLQDLFWLVFNGHYAGMLVALGGVWLTGKAAAVIGFSWPPEPLHFLSSTPAWIQFIGLLVIKDFLEWMIHIMLHRVPWLWEFHKVHHSIRELDWIGNFRFHIMEIVVYRSITWFPVFALGIDGKIALAVAIFTTFIGHLNHSNIKMDYGPLRYVCNSPRLHVWHHDTVLHGNGGQNFAIIFSTWDWLFKTMYYPKDRDQPEELGFDGIDSFPQSLPGRLLHPLPLERK